ncbi:hypothetical protein [Streptomyces sp. NPDC001492]
MNPPFDDPAPRQVQPGEYPALDEALALVNRDLAATLPEQAALRMMARPHWEESELEIVYLSPPNGDWWGSRLWLNSPEAPRDDPLATLTVVAEAAQDALTEDLWQAWPVCTVHDLGMHLGEADGRPVWRCVGTGQDPAHVRAAVGELGTLRPGM